MERFTYFLTPLIVGLLVIMVSCTDLTEEPYGEITEENFQPTERDIPNLVAPVYADLRDLWMGWQGLLELQEEAGDAFVTPTRPNGWYDGGVYVQMHKHTWDEFLWQPWNAYNSAFAGINAANRVIHQIESGQVQMEDEQEETQLLAELRVLRAYYYYKLLDNHGNVPIVTDWETEEVPEQNTRQELYDFIENQLSDNIPHLTETVNRSTYGRMTKWAGKTLLARLYLNAEIYTGTPQYEEVIPVADEIIDSGHYGLEANYKDNFTREEHFLENIWVVPFDEIQADWNGLHMKTLKPQHQQIYGMQAQPWGGSAANPQFIESYDEDDTRLDDTWINGPQYVDGEEVYDFVNHIPGINHDDNEFDHGYPASKLEVYEGMTASSSVDVPIMRYSEVLMMKAEALLRTGQPGQAANIVTQVRERAFEETDPAKAEVTGQELQEGSNYPYGWYNPDGSIDLEGGDDIEYGRMLDELGWEFAMEGKRRRQLIRFQVAGGGSVFTEKSWFNREPKEEHVEIFPIPQNVLDTNPKLDQNPGY